jgi:hypothetical protein
MILGEFYFGICRYSVHCTYSPHLSLTVLSTEFHHSQNWFETNCRFYQDLQFHFKHLRLYKPLKRFCVDAVGLNVSPILTHNSIFTNPPNIKAYITVFGPPLWSSGQSSWLQIRRPGFDSRHYQKKK